MAAFTSIMAALGAAAALGGTAYSISESERARGEAEEQQKKQERERQRLMNDEHNQKALNQRGLDRDRSRSRQQANRRAAATGAAPSLLNLASDADTNPLLGSSTIGDSNQGMKSLLGT